MVDEVLERVLQMVLELACIWTEEVVFEIVFIDALAAFVTLLCLFLLRSLRYDLDYGL